MKKLTTSARFGVLAPHAAFASLFALATFVIGCAPSDRETQFHAQKALLERQNQGIRELIADAEKGALLPEDRFLIGLDERRWARSLYLDLPERAKPSPLNFVFSDLTGRQRSPDAATARLSLLDFDAY